MENNKNYDDCLVPNSFNQISDTIKAKLKERYGITDVDYKGSNISILTDMIAYGIAIGNTNLNFGIRESILETASIKKNIVSLGRNLGYEPKRKISYKYKIKLQATKNGLLTIPRFSTFKSSNGIPYIYLGDDTSYKFGFRCGVVINNEEMYENLKVQVGNDKGTTLISNDGEIVELLSKSSIGEYNEILVSLDGEGILSTFSKQPTSIYKKMPKNYVPKLPFQGDDEEIDGETDDEKDKDENNENVNQTPEIATQSLTNPDDFQYVKLGDIETFVLDNSDENQPKLLIQLKNINPLEIPLLDEFKNTPLFTDDLRYDGEKFEGFKIESYDENSEVLIVNLIDFPIYDEIFQYKKKRLAIIGRNNPNLKFKEDNIVMILKSSSNVKECELIVTQGELLSDETNQDLRIIVDEQIQNQGFVILDYENIEENGVFLEISRVNSRNELILKQPFTKREEFLPAQGIDKEDTTFIVLNEFTNRFNYLKVFTAFANTGTPLYAGNICYFKLIKSLGSNGEAQGAIEPDSISDDFVAVPVDFDVDGKPIEKILYCIGSDEEASEKIKTNAPLFKNLAERLVTKRDYKTFLLTIPSIEKGQVWGGEELDAPRVGHVFFSFVPISRSTTFESNQNKTDFVLENIDNRELFFLPEKQILMEEDGGLPDSIFETLSNRKIITLQFHNIFPSYLDFIIYVKIIKYPAGISEIDLRQKIFDRIRAYFVEIENFESEMYESNLVKTIDLEFDNKTGIAIKPTMSVDMIKDDFFISGENEIEKDVNRYKVEFLFEFPVDGIFTDNVYNPDGSIGEYGKLILSQLPFIKASSFIEDKDKLEFDYENIQYQVLEYGKLTTKVGNVDDITSNAKEFKIPIIHNCDSVDASSEWQGKRTLCGALVAYPKSKILHLEIYATESKTDEDLEKAFPISVFERKRTINVESDINMKLRFQTFPRLKSVHFVTNFE